MDNAIHSDAKNPESPCLLPPEGFDSAVFPIDWSYTGILISELPSNPTRRRSVGRRSSAYEPSQSVSGCSKGCPGLKSDTDGGTWDSIGSPSDGEAIRYL
jgi:hypothetical protein